MITKRLAPAVLCLIFLPAVALAGAEPQQQPKQEQKPQNAPQQDAPAELGTEIVLQGLSEPACRDIYEIVTQHALVRLNYERSAEPAPKEIPGASRRAHLVGLEGGRTVVVGLQCYATQDSRLYLWGVAAGGQVNPDLERLVEVAEGAAEARQKNPGSFAVRDLLLETYQLTNMSVESALQVLNDLGYNTKAPASKQVKLADLPAVFAMPMDEMKQGVVGRSSINREDQRTLPDPTMTGREHRLMMVYHPSQSEELEDLKDLLEQTIDVPAQQVLIEGMLIELTEQDLKELGAEWEAFGADEEKWTFLQDGDERPFIFSFDPEFTAPEDLANRVRTTIRMLIQQGRGEVLSSPSVLVLDNRNAKIQIIEDVPIVESIITERTTDVKVRFERVGMILNIKPRISKDSSSVSLQIMVEVSEAPPEDFFTVREQAVAPLINRRVVETIARVRDNTPFIIGGLIRDENRETLDRIPLLSRIPLLGALFQARTDRRNKREVIIVLTPRVIQAGGSDRPVMPKDSERFDFLDNRLFRNSYRLKADDVFDLGFLENNESVLETMRRAKEFVAHNPRYAEKSPWREMIQGTIPGERAVVVRMIYEVAKRKLELHRQVEAENLILFNSQRPGHTISLGKLNAEQAEQVYEVLIEAACEEFGYQRAETRRPDRNAQFSRAVKLVRTTEDGDELRVTLGLMPSEDDSPQIYLWARRNVEENLDSSSPDLTSLLEMGKQIVQAAGGSIDAIDEHPAGFNVQFLAGGRGLLEQKSPDGTVQGYFNRPYPKEVLFLRFTRPPDGGLRAALRQPTAHVEWVEVDSYDETQARLLRLNSLGQSYDYQEYAIAIDRPDDMDRLKTAIAMREIANVNDIGQLLQLRNFRVGRKIVIPELEGPDRRIFLIDRMVAEFFFKSDYYYYALKQRLERAYDIVGEALRMEGTW